MKKLPIGTQSFKVVREEKNANVYVDKTKQILDIINAGNNQKLFLSRPRRFGKSLLVDTIKCLYEGKKELFYDTYAEKHWDFEKTNPVIKISFGTGLFKIEDLEGKFIDLLNENQVKHNVEELKSEGVDFRFIELIRKIYEKNGKKVVVLIDEYDKLILDYINNLEEAKIIRNKLRNFYGGLKDADEYLEFVFITGVSKFSKVSLFSGLNNLTDLTLDPMAGELVGFTKQEILDNFDDYLQGVDFEKMQKWYNGFNFLGEDKVFNPFDVLLFFRNKEYRPYWFETATPTFLINLLKESENFYYLPDLENISAGGELLGSFDIENISLETLLFQTGYLTIKNKISDDYGILYNLVVPNIEIKKSLNNYIIIDYLGVYKNIDYIKRTRPIYDALVGGNIEDFIKYLKVLFVNISYTNSLEKIAKYEGYYSSVIYTLFYAMGLDVIQEDITNQGRIDLTIKLKNKIYIIEFKVEKTGLKALEQIKEKKYSKKYLAENKEIYEVGINFSFEDRNIESFEFDKIS